MGTCFFTIFACFHMKITATLASKTVGKSRRGGHTWIPRVLCVVQQPVSRQRRWGIPLPVCDQRGRLSRLCSCLSSNSTKNQLELLVAQTEVRDSHTLLGTAKEVLWSPAEQLMYLMPWMKLTFFRDSRRQVPIDYWKWTQLVVIGWRQEMFTF